VESWDAAEIAAVYGTYGGIPAAYPASVPVPRRARLRPLGLHSDDTQQSLALLAVCLADTSQRGWTPAAWGRCLVEGARRKAWRGTGKYFDAAVQRLGQGVEPQLAGSPSAGIGAAMRVAPLGALYRDQSRRLAEVTLESSAMTHADLRAIALAYAVAWASAALVNGRSVVQVRTELPDAVAEAEDEWLHGKTAWNVDRASRHQLSLGLARVLAVAKEDVVALGADVTRLAEPFMQKGFPRAHPNHAFALLGGLYGLAAGLALNVEPNAALLAIVRQGADTDTVAAIAGGVFGARFGSAWVPRDQIRDRVRIESYAQALVHRTVAPETVDVLLQHEAALTAQELAFQGETQWPR